MKFIKANIYGFGKWVDQTILFPDKEPICFYGENESGKTTIQQFILYILFGLPPRKLTQYKPMNSNKIGGILVVEDEEIGQYSIERMEQQVICYAPSGEMKDEAWLQERLKGLNRDVFTSIYAFSAVDLTTIQTMNRTELSDVLFSVGLSGSTHIYEAEKELDKKVDHLFKRQGRIPIMNKQIKQTDTAYKAMIDSQKKEAHYEAKQGTMEQLQDDKNKYDERATTLQAKLLKTEKIQSLLPQLHKYEQAEAQLQKYPEQISFPEKGLERLEKLKATMLPLKSDIQVLRSSIEQSEIDKAAYEAALYDRIVLDEAIAVSKKKATYEHLLERQTSEKLQLERYETRLTNETETIDMTIDEIDSLSLPFHLEKHWDTLAREQTELLQIGEKQTAIHDTLQDDTTRLTKDKQQLQEKKLSQTEFQQLQKELAQTNSTNQTETDNRTWQGWKESRMKTAKNVLIGSAVIAIIATMMAFFMENFILLAIPFVLLAVGILHFFNVKRTMDFFIGTDKAVSSNDLHSRATPTYDEKQAAVNEQFMITSELEAIDKQLAQKARERTAWQKEQTAFLNKENEWIQQVEQERAAYPFLKTIDLPYWVDLLMIMRKVKQLLTEKYQIETDLRDITDELQIIENERLRVSQLLQDEDTLLTFEQIETIIHKQQSKQHLLEQIIEKINQTEMKIEQNEQEMLVYEREQFELFTIAHVDSEEAYLQVAKEQAALEQLHAEMMSTKSQLTRMFSEAETGELLQEKLREQDVTLQLTTVERELADTKQKQSAINEQIAKLQLEIEQLERSDDHSTAIYQYQMEVDTLQEQAEEWAILKVAQTALATAKMNYQANHLDEVLDYTASFFHQITNGNYERVFAPTEDASFQVEGSDHIIYTIDKLSQGTVDQLYVSLRLAISVVMSHRYKMPLMMDDAFVHFDMNRTKCMLDIVKDLAKEHQIILFTCNHMIAHQLQSEDLSHIAQNR